MNRKSVLPIIISSETSLHSGRRWWRSLEELADTPEFQEYLHREFPENATQWLAGSRRDFLRLMGASLFLAGVSGCDLIRQPQETIVPTVGSTGHASPGLPLYFATAFDFAGSAIGLTVESRDGRPIKIEGNPNHPSSLGATNIFAQAATLDLYDPDRSRTAMNKENIVSQAQVASQLTALRLRFDETNGRGLRVLMGTSTSPTLARVLHQSVARWPEMKWSVYESVNDDAFRAGMKLVRGVAASNLSVVYDFSRADVVLSIDCDFLAARDLPPCYVQGFSAARRVVGRPKDDARATDSMVRLYHIGPTPTPTFAKADHNLALGPTELAAAVSELARVWEADAQDDRTAKDATLHSEWITRVVADLKAAGARALVCVGREQPAAIHALGHLLNQELAAVGNTVHYIESPQVRPQDSPSDVDMLAELVSEMEAGKVETLLILGGNPVFDAPADINFGAALEKVHLTLTLTSAANETSQKTKWLLPRTHFLESWGDSRAHDGTVSIVQPLIAPLHEGISDIELMAMLCEDAPRAYAAVRKTWKEKLGERDDDLRWQKTVADGIIEGSASAPVELANDQTALSSISVAEFVKAHWVDAKSDGKSNAPRDVTITPSQTTSPTIDGFDIVIRPDPTIWDGRFTNNGWLQELPKPLTHTVWENPALMAPADAKRWGLRNGDVLAIGEADGQIDIPIWIAAGHAEGCLTLFKGFGRSVAGRVGQGTGFDIRSLISKDAMAQRRSVAVRKTASRHAIVTTQHFQTMEGRHLVRAGTLAELQAEPDGPAFVHPPDPTPEATLYPDWPYEGHKWGMTIDLTACVGCSACVLACQAENNIPVVGKEQVGMNRHMHWIRVDTYYTGPPEQPQQMLNQPVTCMHCERAPCEVVCPVAATNHSDEGLNQMVYNRCVGTRYCSNNCPYKVRRFNFLDFSDKFINEPTLHLLSNPEVTMRQRGVMEKCTYCVQRIEGARVVSQLEDRPIRDGEIKTACQAACPAQAIRFGDLNDPASEVRQTHDHPLAYALLEELNTKPRTTYLAEVTNPREPT
ncbi:MAG: TAT-variant-translocated molybdopterin oxidoreductase [Planctomycetales bacterium]|nr:TAT-variant-translocated molybdopterin oxidoreductase [Planctomycetales bacterium]